MDEEGRDDLDRAAILARRQRFIALALSGLSASCGETSGPQVCLSIGPGDSSTTDAGSGSGSESSGSTTMPMPCLDIGPMTTEESGPADDTGTSGTDTGTTGATSESGTSEDGTAESDTGTTGG
jgi:hypothetical protein